MMPQASSQMNPNIGQGMNLNQLAMMQQHNTGMPRSPTSGYPGGSMGGYPNFYPGRHPDGQSTVDKLFQQQGGPEEGISLTALKQILPTQTQQSKKQKGTPKTIELDKQTTDGDMEEQRDKIRHLVKNINHGLEGYAPSKSISTENNDSDDHDNETEKEPEKPNVSLSTSNLALEVAKEASLLVLVYVILSQTFVRKTVGAYVCYINPREDGTVSILGYMIYGLILSLVFIFFKKILLK